MLASLLDKTASFWQYRQVFSSFQDVNRFRNVRNGTDGTSVPIEIEVRESASAPLLCRPGTLDAITLWETFHHKYHLPDEDLNCETCVVSLGANVGYTSANMGRLYPRARIVAVEMDADNYALCQKNLAQMGDRCSVLHAAVWTEEGEVQYRRDADVNSFAIDTDGSDGGELVTVPTITLNRLFDQESIETVDYLVMDIEGAESHIFNADLSWTERVNALCVEIHPPATFEQIRSALESVGFHCERHSRHWDSILGYRRTSR